MLGLKREYALPTNRGGTNGGDYSRKQKAKKRHLRRKGKKGGLRRTTMMALEQT
jgi:hypothetical protein